MWDPMKGAQTAVPCYSCRYTEVPCTVLLVVPSARPERVKLLSEESLRIGALSTVVLTCKQDQKFWPSARAG